MERMCSLDFPPFPLISRVLQTIQRGKSSGGHCCSKMANSNMVACILWCKCWPTTMPIFLPNRKTMQTFPGNPAKIQPLYPKLELLMCHLSGDPLKAKEFGRKLQGLSYSPGGLIMQANTKLTTKSGKSSAVNRTLIHFKPLYKMV